MAATLLDVSLGGQLPSPNMTSQNSANTSGGGIGFTGLLTVLFVALKLTHVIAWSWWWILSPLWISALVILVVLCVALLVAVLTGD
jgi:predicted outer membrane repeat protein